MKTYPPHLPLITGDHRLTLDHRNGVNSVAPSIWLKSLNIKQVEDETGRPRVVFNEPKFPARTFERVIYALGGTTPANFLRTLGIAFNDQGPIFDGAGATNVPGLYLIGDLVVGKKGGSIMTAFNSAVHAMKHICVQDLHCNPRHPKEFVTA